MRCLYSLILGLFLLLPPLMASDSTASSMPRPSVTTKIVKPVSATISESARGAQAPWLLTLDQHIESRFDSKRAQNYGASVRNTAARPANFTLDGRIDPSVFLPNELMGMLLNQYMAAQNNVAVDRRTLTQDDGLVLDLLGEPATFWRAVDKAGAEYLVLVRNNHIPSRKSDDSICAARVTALNILRSTYPHIDEFLYRTVGSRTVRISAVTETREDLLRNEGGCK
jgi:hypothetical protein